MSKVHSFTPGQKLWWNSDLGRLQVEYRGPSKSGKRAYVYRVKNGMRQYSTWVTYAKLEPRND